MGSRHPWNIPFSVVAWGKDTVADMLAARWEVELRCKACGLVARVSLPFLAHYVSPDFVLWDRHPPCVNARCYARATYFGRPPRYMIHRPLIEAERRRDDGL